MLDNAKTNIYIYILLPGAVTPVASYEAD